MMGGANAIQKDLGTCPRTQGQTGKKEQMRVRREARETCPSDLLLQLDGQSEKLLQPHSDHVVVVERLQ